MHEVIVNEVKVNNDKVLVDVSITKEFKSWFVENQGLKKWSHMRFQRVFLDALEATSSVKVNVEKGKVKVCVV